MAKKLTATIIGCLARTRIPFLPKLLLKETESTAISSEGRVLYLLSLLQFSLGFFSRHGSVVVVLSGDAVYILWL